MLWFDFCKTFKKIEMLKKICFLLLFTSILSAQHSVNGKMEPASNYSWIVLYQLQGAKQNYIANAKVIDGEFSLTIPKNTEKGIYRLIYDLKNRLFVDFIYDNENIRFTFNPKYPDQFIKFTESENNKLYHAYLEAISLPQQKLDSLQVRYFNSSDKTEQENIVNSYYKFYSSLIAHQSNFEQLSNNKFVSHFIKASSRFNTSKPINTPSDYLVSIKTHFFHNIDFNNSALLNSSFINDKINDFIFYLNTSEDKKMLTQLQREAIATVINKIGSNKTLAKDIEEGLLYTFSQQENIVMVNYMLNQYLQLPKELQDTAFINDIKEQLKTAVGMPVPNIMWNENSTQKDLYGLTGSNYYVVAFWSSTCPHCLIEMPLLYDFLKDNSQTKVISVGLEDNTSKSGWETQIINYPKFINVYGENKWKNKFARDYGVNATPSFFVLDTDKKVIAKPDDVEELKAFFKN